MQCLLGTTNNYMSIIFLIIARSYFFSVIGIINYQTKNKEFKLKFLKKILYIFIQLPTSLKISTKNTAELNT